MANKASIRRITLQRYKAFARFSLAMRRANVLTGANNSGKSTLIGALRLLEAGIRKARARKPIQRQVAGARRLCYELTSDDASVSLENVHHEYGDTPAEVVFDLSAEKRLRLYFPAGGGAFMLAESSARPIASPTEFVREFPLQVRVVPTLGPVEHNEQLLTREVVQRGLGTHRAATHFRNYWYHFPEDFDRFAELLRSTWPDLDIERPRPDYGGKTFLSMMCREQGVPRELYWVGFGFQVWCQILTHIVRSSGTALFAIDEPEIYLHPDLQRQLVHILRTLGPDIVVATHSSEIINECEPTDIVTINKKRTTGRRLDHVDGVQEVLTNLGSSHNVVLSQLSRTRTVLFVEGEDATILRAFARRLGYRNAAAGASFTVVPIGGFGNRDRVEHFTWVLSKTIRAPIRSVAVFDRDYYCDEEVDQITCKLSATITRVHVHKRKELENYLLVPRAMERAVRAAIADRERRGGSSPQAFESIDALLAEASETFGQRVCAQLSGRRIEFHRHNGQDAATITEQAIVAFNAEWRRFESRLAILPGKEFLSRVNELLQERFKVSVTFRSIIDAMAPEEVPRDLDDLLRYVDQSARSPADNTGLAALDGEPTLAGTPADD